MVPNLIPNVPDTHPSQDNQTFVSADHHERSLPTPPWRGWSPLLRLLGVAVALVGGIVLSIPMYAPAWLPVVGVLVVEAAAWGFVAAVLVRAGWAVLIVPAVFSVGFYVSNVYQMYGIDFRRLFDPWGLFQNGAEGMDILVLLGVIPILVGVAIGIPIGKWMEERLGLAW